MVDRIVLTRPRAAAIVTLSYASVAFGFEMLLCFVEAARGWPDPHHDLVIGLSSAAMVIAWIWSMAEIWPPRMVRRG